MAKEYIDRKAAVAALLGDETVHIPTLMFAQKRIEAVPAADVVPVVRCKDCKHMTSHYDTDGNVPYWTCSEWDGGTDYDGYCHYGERKQDG